MNVASPSPLCACDSSLPIAYWQLFVSATDGAGLPRVRKAEDDGSVGKARARQDGKDK